MPGSHGCGPTKRRRLHRRTAHSRSKEGATMAKANPAAPIRVIEETPAYWRVVFDYPPFNILDATIFGGLQDLLLRMDASQTLRVVVFDSEIPDLYLAHFDLIAKTVNITTADWPFGLPILMDTFLGLTKSSVVSI